MVIGDHSHTALTTEHNLHKIVQGGLVDADARFIVKAVMGKEVGEIGAHAVADAGQYGENG